jgi:hypothetical protein
MQGLEPRMSIERLLALACLLCWPALAMADPPDAQSRYMPTGPPPTRGYEAYSRSMVEVDQTVIGAVPSYLWRHGCGPTAAGMVIGYWDGQGFPALIPGGAASQTSAVNQSIASGNGANTHYSDYSQPLDYRPDPISPDRSEPPAGDEHTSHCVADFMGTSWSSRNNYYGWSWFSDVDDALRDYAAYINAAHGTSYEVTSWNESWSTFSWEKYIAEIDAGRPLVFLVDTNGNGSTDHFVTAIGYRDTSGYPEYACFDTWSHSVRWERFRAMSSSYSWGIYGATYFVPVNESFTGGPLSGRKLLVRDREGLSAKRRVTFLSKDRGISSPSPDSATDPTLNGATLRLVNRATGESATLSLPASNWRRLGDDPGAAKGYRYRDSDRSEGPCRSVRLRPERLLRAVCKGEQIDFTLDEAGGQGALVVTLQLGSATPYCTLFGGTILKDQPIGSPPSGMGLFKAVNAPAAKICE